MLSEDDYFKEKLVEVLSDIEGKLVKCHINCQWVGIISECERDPSDGSYVCPNCGMVASDYASSFISAAYREELNRITLPWV